MQSIWFPHSALPRHTWAWPFVEELLMVGQLSVHTVWALTATSSASPQQT
jgi:hypothetical protein